MTRRAPARDAALRAYLVRAFEPRDPHCHWCDAAHALARRYRAAVQCPRCGVTCGGAP